jgi:GntR family transcriptional regulator/MocR family aminotransferase
MTIWSGSQQALDLIARILVDPGDRVVLEEPQFEGARQAFGAAGARIVAVPVDEDGLQVARLPAGSSRCRAVYVTPSHQFPTGAVLSAQRRRQLLEWAQEHGCFVVEDDYDGELRYDIRPIEAIKAADADDRVIYVGTMSKVLFPSIRLGYIVSPRSLVSTLVAAKHVCDRQTPMLLQSSLSDFFAKGHFNRHLVRARRLCSLRRAAFLKAVDEHLGSKVTVAGASAGIHVMMWLEHRQGKDVPELIAQAAEASVGIYSIAPYFIHAPRRAGFLLGYASMEEDMIHEGVKRLAKVFA